MHVYIYTCVHTQQVEREKNKNKKCISRESNAGPIESQFLYGLMATMDFTTKPLMLLQGA